MRLLFLLILLRPPLYLQNDLALNERDAEESLITKSEGEGLMSECEGEPFNPGPLFPGAVVKNVMKKTPGLRRVTH